MPDELTFAERVRRQAASQSLTFAEQVRQEVSARERPLPLGVGEMLMQRDAAQQTEQATQEEAQMQQARGQLERSPLPGFKAFGVAAGAPIVSGIARLLGQGAYADTMNRTAARIEQAQREREKGGPIPDVLQSGLRGAGASAVTMFGAGMVGGPAAAIAAASAREANKAITEGKDAGKTGKDLARYAIGQGVIEGAPAYFMQKIGLGGIESLVGKRAVVTGMQDALKRFGVQFTAEHVEEQVTEYLHNNWSAFEDVDPEAMSPENIWRTAYETAVQTTIAWGLGNAIVAGKPLNITEAHREMEAYAKEGKVPSRRVYKRWNLGPGLPGDSIPQRRAFIEEMGEQLRESETASQEPLEASLAPVEAEGILGPEAAQEAAGETREPLAGGEVQAAGMGIDTILSPREGLRAVYRGVGPRGMEEMRPSEGGVYGPGVYFYDNPEDAKAYAGRGGGVIAGYVDPKEAEIHEKDVKLVGTDITLRKEAIIVIPNESFLKDKRLHRDQAAPELAPQEGDDATVALNKAQGNRIMEDLGVGPLEKAGRRPWPVVAAEVAVGKLDEKALDNAAEVVKTRRAGTDTEHLAMVMRAGKLMDERDQINVEMAEAAKRNDTKEYDRLVRKIKGTKLGEFTETPGINSQIELLARADAYAATPAARAISIRRLKLSRENYDVVSVIQDYQAAKGPDTGALTEEETSTAGEFSDEILKLQAENDQLRATIEVEAEAKDKADAQKILDSAKPKKGTGRGAAIKAKAATEIEDIKAQIRALGEVGRVNDILGVSAEGSYLIGRLGIAYIKSGIGTLVEVAENLRASFPDVNLSDRDVWQALIASNPKLEASARSEAEKDVSRLKSISRRLISLDDKAQGLWTEAATKQEVSQELARLRKMESDLTKRLRAEEDLEKARQGEFREGVKKPADSSVIAAIKKEINDLRSLQRATKKVMKAREGVFDPTRQKREVSVEIKSLSKEYTQLRNEFYKSDFDKAKLERAIDTVNRLQDLLGTGKKRIKAEPKKIPPELTEMREKARQLNRELDINEELESVNRQLETGIFDPPKVREKKPIDPRLERKQIELARKKKELRQWIADAAPWGVKRTAMEVAKLMKSMKATADVSFTLRQNVWHPFKTLGVGQKAGFIKKAVKGELAEGDKFFPSLHTLFNEYSADQIRNSMVNGPNGFLYEKHGVAILDSNSVGDKDRSEIFQNNVIERSNRRGLKIWGAVMRASSRHAVTIGNLVRTSAFDQFLDNHPNATDAELTAFADYVNVSTGIGNLGHFAAIGEELDITFFSPKFAASRPQTPWSIIKHRKLPRVRNAIARDMVRNVATGLMVLTLADLAGFDVEWWDTDDPDWGSIRFRNTRWDIFGGFKQFARLIARTAKYPFRGEDASDLSPVEMASRSISYKFSPFFTTISELLTGETIIGKEVDSPDWIADITGEEVGKRIKTLVKIPIPIVHEDIYDAVEQEGLLVGVAATVTTLPGIGTQTYQDSRTAAFRKVRMLRGRGHYAEASRYWQNWNEHNRNLPPSKRKKPLGKIGLKKSRK